MIQAICFVVDVSISLDIPILEFSAILNIFHFDLSVSRYCVRCLQPSGREMLSMTFAAVIYDADEPCSVKNA